MHTRMFSFSFLSLFLLCLFCLPPVTVDGKEVTKNEKKMEKKEEKIKQYRYGQFLSRVRFPQLYVMSKNQNYQLMYDSQGHLNFPNGI